VDVIVVVESYSSASTSSITVVSTSQPAPGGYACDVAIDASAGGTWTGSYADFDDLWSGSGSCGYVSSPDPEVWFTGTVAAGNTFTIEETTGTNVTVQQTASCVTTSCVDYATSPERIIYTNSSGSDETLYFAIERYGSSTGSWSVTVTNVP
jgi:hypothetical protein